MILFYASALVATEVDNDASFPKADIEG